MIIIHKPATLVEYLHQQQRKKRTIGFVPTMGALHQGHLKLVEACAGQADVTVCSIFVNPTQFNDSNDYNKYPKLIEHDIALLEASPADILFIPPLTSIYPNGTSQLEHYEIGYLESILEGHYRPGHFQGVCQVMDRLLNIVQPQFLFMGQKDYQQCMVIKKLLPLIKVDTTLVTWPTFREADGLAMSSRNLRLTAAQRPTAPMIYTSLLMAKENISPGSVSSLKIKGRQFLKGYGFDVDYFEIAKADDLTLLENWDGITPIVALVAAFLGEVRLIDNMLLNR